MTYEIYKGNPFKLKGMWQKSNSSARISCPDCGECGSLEGTHSINSNGEVEPSVVCQCGFHEHLFLIDWNSLW